MKIVIRGTNWIGDAVMTIPAMRELRRVLPDAEIMLHTRSWAEGLFRDADFIDGILPYDKGESNTKEVAEQARVPRGRKFDVAVILPNSFASALTARFGGVPARFGYSRDARHLFLTHPLRVPDWKKTRHEVFYYLNLAAHVERTLCGTETVAGNEPDISLRVSPERRAEALKILVDSGIDLAKPTVALGVGSTNSMAKRWPADRYAELNDRLQSESGANVVLLGAADEVEVSKYVFSKTRFKPVLLTGKTDLAEAVAVLAVSDLLISNDMGLAHVAPAVGTQTLVIFGPTNPETTRPYSDKSEVIRNNVECSPCMLRECPIDHRCMMWITVDEVFERAKERLKTRAVLKTV